MKSFEVWSKGLLAAFVSAASTALAGAAVHDFHDLRGAGIVALVAGIVGAALYLKQSPVPK